VVLLACGDPPRRAERIGIAVFVVMMVGSVLPAAILWWFSGDVILLWLGIVWLRSRRQLPRTRSPDERVTPEDDRSTLLPVAVSAGGDSR
jgi:hypothetical protein